MHSRLMNENPDLDDYFLGEDKNLDFGLHWRLKNQKEFERTNIANKGLLF